MSLSVVDMFKSKLIFKELMQGRVINKAKSVTEPSVESELYTEIFRNLNDYKFQYQMAGFELVSKPGFYFIRDNDLDSANSDITKRIQVLLLIIGRYLTKAGYAFDMLKHPKGGLNGSHIKEISEDEEYQEILKAADVDGLSAAVKSTLVQRGIMEEVEAERYVLTEAGSFFFDELFIQYSSSVIDKF